MRAAELRARKGEFALHPAAAALPRTMAWAALLVVSGLTCCQETTLEKGQFQIALDKDNHYLPASIRWKPADVELLAGKAGLNHTFYAFEFRDKRFREENKEFCGKSPKYANEVEGATVQSVEQEDFSGVGVRYTSSLAKVHRAILCHKSEPRLRIAYDFEMTREVTIHDPEYFGIQVRLDSGFSGKTVADVRPDEIALISASKLEKPMFYLPIAYTGPAVFENTGKKAYLLIRGDCGGDVPAAPPDSMIILRAGQKLTFVLEMRLASGDRSVLEAALLQEVRAAPVWRKPFFLVNTASVLEARQELPEAQAALLLAAELNKRYSQPYCAMAMLKLPGRVDPFVKAAYRRPYDYGMMMMTGYDPYGKTAADKRLHLFNRLICNEATPFCILPYLRPADMFEQLGMLAQACAMYRQALWAADYTNETEKEKERLRGMCRDKIAALEKKLLGKTCADLLPLIPVQAADETLVPEKK